MSDAPPAAPAAPAPAATAPAPAPPEPSPGWAASLGGFLLVVLMAACLGVGVWSLSTGPYRPTDEERRDEYELFGSTALMSMAAPEGVAVVRVDGPIAFDSEGNFGGARGADWTVSTLRRLRRVRAVKAVVLRVNSPGGTVAASEEIWRQILALQKADKKVVVSMADMAASGGYYISAPADYIFANGGTITGSIGVITQLTRLKELADKVGYGMESVTSGAFKDMGNPFRDLRDDEKELFRTTIMEAYLQFVEAVAHGRARAILAAEAEPKDGSRWEERMAKIRAGEAAAPFADPEPAMAEGFTTGSAPALGATTAPAGTKPAPIDFGRVRRRVAELADGRIYMGVEAKRVGLVDELGTLQDAISKAGELAGLGPDPQVLRPKGPSDFQGLFSLLGQARAGGGLADLLGRSLGLVRPLAPAALPVAYLYNPGG